MYLRARVEAFIEQHQDEYEQLLEKRAERSARANLTASRRVQELLRWAKETQIKVSKLPRRFRQLEDETVNAFLMFRAFERNDYGAEFTLTWNAVVAHVRHTRTNYEYLLGQIEGKPGCYDAYLVLKARCNEIVEKALRERYGRVP